MRNLFLICFMLALAGCGQRSVRSDECLKVKVDTVVFASEPESVELPAKIKSAEEVNLAFKVSGTLERVAFHEGDFVHRGDVVAELDPRDYRLQLQAVEGEYLDVKSAADRAVALYADSVASAADYDKARYGLQQITAKYENAKNQLADTKLCAPFDGYVKHRLYDPPAVVGAGMPVVTLFSSGMPEVEVYIPASTYRRRGDIGSFVLRLDFMPESIPLKLISISPEANANQLYAVRLALPESLKERPSVGMSAMVDILYKPQEGSGFSIPASALFSDGGESFVWLCEEGRAVRRKVVVESLHTDGRATVSQGLKEGDVIVTAGVHRIRDGQCIEPLKPVSATNKGGLL